MGRWVAGWMGRGRRFCAKKLGPQLLSKVLIRDGGCGAEQELAF